MGDCRLCQAKVAHQDGQRCHVLHHGQGLPQWQTRAHDTQEQRDRAALARAKAVAKRATNNEVVKLFELEGGEEFADDRDDISEASAPSGACAAASDDDRMQVTSDDDSGCPVDEWFNNTDARQAARQNWLKRPTRLVRVLAPHPTAVALA